MHVRYTNVQMHEGRRAGRIADLQTTASGRQNAAKISVEPGGYRVLHNPGLGQTRLHDRAASPLADPGGSAAPSKRA
jgi:hypothetical protein